MALSDGWRINKSTIQNVEMVLVLRALQKVIGTMSPDEIALTYTTGLTRTTRPPGAEIFINPGVAITGDWPLLPGKFDVLVGLACHEAGHRLWEMTDIDRVRDLVTDELSSAGNVPRVSSFDQVEEMLLEQFVALGEEIYVDHTTVRHFPIQGTYIMLARTHDRKPVEWGKILLSFHSVLIIQHIYNHEVPPEVSQLYDSTVWKIVNSFLMSLRIRDLTLDKREHEYAKVWAGLLAITQVQKQQELVQKSKEVAKSQEQVPAKLNTAMQDLGYDSVLQPELISEDIEPKDSPSDIRAKARDQQEGSNLDSGQNLEPVMGIHPGPGTDKLDVPLKYMDSLIAKANLDVDNEAVQDLTQVIGEALEHGTEADAIVLEPSKEMVLDSSYDQQLVKDLEGLTRLKNSVGYEVRRLLIEGRLDRRRIARHQTSTRIRRLTVREPRQRLDLVLLLDASSSMVRNRDIYLASKAIFDANLNGKTYVYDYVAISRNRFGKRGQHYNVKINNLTWDGRFHGVKSKGGTPSGEALMAMAIQHPDSLILHFTDGESNSGRAVQDAAEEIRRKYRRTLVLNIILDLDNNFDDDAYELAESNRFRTKIIHLVEEYPKVVIGQLTRWARERLLQ